jgi:threonine dehydrogenase-like Zn-dependent dehydrogenase
VDLLPFGHYIERGIAFEHGFSQATWLDRPEHLFLVDPQIQSVAVLTEPLSVAEKGINEAVAVQRGRMGDSVWNDPPPRVLVTGMGPIGFSALVACRCRQWSVTMYGRDKADSFRACLAVDCGASYLSDDELDAWLNNIEDRIEDDGFDLILECTGSDEVMLRVSQLLVSCGVMVWVGSSRIPRPRSHNVSLLMRNGILRNHIHLGTVNAAPRDFQQALDHLKQFYAERPRTLESLITDRVAPTESLWHYIHRATQGIKTVLMYD